MCVDLTKPDVNKNSYAQMSNFLLYSDNQEVCFKKLSTLDLKNSPNNVALFRTFVLVCAKFYIYFSIRIKNHIFFSILYIYTHFMSTQHFIKISIFLVVFNCSLFLYTIITIHFFSPLGIHNERIQNKMQNE